MSESVSVGGDMALAAVTGWEGGASYLPPWTRGCRYRSPPEQDVGVASTAPEELRQSVDVVEYIITYSRHYSQRCTHQWDSGAVWEFDGGPVSF